MIMQLHDVSDDVYCAGPGSPNVHAEWVELQGTVNSFSVSGLNYLKSRISEVSCHLAYYFGDIAAKLCKTSLYCL